MALRRDAEDRPKRPPFVSCRDDTGVALSMYAQTTEERTSRDRPSSALASAPIAKTYLLIGLPDPRNASPTAPPRPLDDTRGSRPNLTVQRVLT